MGPGPRGRSAALRRAFAGVGLLTGALAGTSGCEDPPAITRLPQPAIQTDVLPQRSGALVDILWVVDNSTSMRDEQAALADNFERFIAGLTTCQGTGVADDLCDFETKTCAVSGLACNPPDYHIGVISTDVDSAFDRGKLRRVGVCTTAPGATPSGGRYRYCLNDDADCLPDPEDPNADPANRTCDMDQAIGFVTATTPGAASAFSRAVRVGLSGIGRETGIEAAARALGRFADRETGGFVEVPAENAGFLRPGASLFVIFVSDEDDRSFGTPVYYYRTFETLKGTGNEGLVSMSAIVGDPDVDGADGPEPGGCEVPGRDPEDDPTRNLAGTRYVALSMYTRGVSPEFRVCDSDRLVCAANEACERPIEGVPGVCVPAEPCDADGDCGAFVCEDGRGCVSCEQGTCRTEPRRFLELLERNGVFGSICESDYGGVLDALGFEAAGLARKFDLSIIPNCGGDPVPCCAEGVDPDACTDEAPICVTVDGAPVPNQRDAGWVYDAASNAVFFDGRYVPPAGSTVQVAYTAFPNGNTDSCRARLQ